MSTTSHHPNPQYFSTVDPDLWTIHGYLDFCFPLHASFTDTQYHAILNKWLPALRDLVGSSNPDQASAARSLVDRRVKDGVSARNWFSSRMRNGKKHRHRGSGRLNRTTIKRSIHGPAAVHISSSPQESPAGSLPPPATVINGSVGVINSGILHSPIIDQRSAGSSSYHQEATASSRDYSPDRAPSTSSAVDRSSDQGSEFESSPPPGLHGDSSAYDSELTLEPPREGSPSFGFSATGRILEDIIRDSNLPDAHLARQGAIVLADEELMRLFETSEREEIVSHIPPPPEADPLFMRSITRFARAKTFADFRDVAENIPYRDGEYNHSTHAQAGWVNQVILWMLPLLHSYGDLHSRELTEGWFDSSFWSILIDCCSFSFSWMTLRRKELPSWSLKSLAPLSKMQTDKTNKESHFDGIIHDHADPLHHEFGVFEVAKSFTTMESSKWVKDERKIIIGLHGMARKISRVEPALPNIQVVGLVHARFSFVVLTGTSLSPTLTLISRGELRTIPATIEKLRDILIPLKSLHLAMKTMDRCRTALARSREGLHDADGSDAGSQFLRDLDNSGY